MASAVKAAGFVGQMTNSVKRLVFRMSGFNQIGLYHDDCLYENEDVKEALRRLPQSLKDDRLYRMNRAIHLSFTKTILPKDQWISYEEIFFLSPIIMKCLTESQLKGYERDGFIVLDLLTDAEVEELSKDYDAIFEKQARDDMEATWDGSWNKQKGKTEVYSIHALQLYSAAFTRLLLNERILDALQDIFGSSNIILHHTKAHLKPPGTGSPFPMHQDYHYFPHEKDSMVAVFISLDDAAPENGGLCVYPGSHKLGPQKDCSDNDITHYVDQTKFPLEKATPLVLQRGQVLIFSYLLVHGSYNNTSKNNRRMYLMQMYEGDDVPKSKDNMRPCQTMVLRGERTSSSRSEVWRPALLQERVDKKRKHQKISM